MKEDLATEAGSIELGYTNYGMRNMSISVRDRADAVYMVPSEPGKAESW